MTEIKFGRIIAEFKNNQVIVKQINPIFEKEIRRYTRIPNDVCNICLLPQEKCQGHQFFIDDKNDPILDGLMVGSYYKKNPFSRFTEEMAYIRSRNNLSPNNLLFIIFKEVLKAAILNFEKNFDIITSPPTKYNSIKEIIKETAADLNISYVPIEKLINYDKKLHKDKSVRDGKDSNKIFELVQKIYKTNDEIYSGIDNILISDDVISTGATINRISYLLKMQGVKSVYGFAWLRAIGSD